MSTPMPFGGISEHGAMCSICFDWIYDFEDAYKDSQGQIWADHAACVLADLRRTAEWIMGRRKWMRQTAQVEDRDGMERLAWVTQEICDCDSMGGRAGAHHENCPVSVLRKHLAEAGS